MTLCSAALIGRAKLLRLCLGSVAIATMPCSVAAAPPDSVPAPAIASEERAFATDLAETIFSLPRFLQMFDGPVDRMLDQKLDDAESLKTLERDYPGISAIVKRALKAEVARLLGASFPDVWGKMADILVEEMSAAELNEALAFYRSPTGQWMVSEMYAALEGTRLVTRVMEDADADISAADSAAASKAVAARLASVPPQHQKAVASFHRTPAASKLNRLMPRLNACADFALGRASLLSAEDVIVKAMSDHIERVDAARGGEAK